MLNFNIAAFSRSIMGKASEKTVCRVEKLVEQGNALQNYWVALSKYQLDFMIPFLLAVNYFQKVERNKLLKTSPMESFQSYMKLFNFNMEMYFKSLMGSMRAINDYYNMEMKGALDAIYNTIFEQNGEDLLAYIERQAYAINRVGRDYPQAIKEIEPEFGFHFERGNDVKFAETDRFILYRIAPTDKKVKIRKNTKPILIIPPYVLGANILAFLPNENRSYTHNFANQGIPVYIRIMKDIQTTEALQMMTPEDDTRDTRFFCEKIKAEHGKPVTLNGYCQGGFSAVCGVLSGELDGLVDALLTCVAPIDGTKSEGLAHFLQSLPKRFNDLSYGIKTLPNGNKVADGDLMGWVYKLKSIGNESPIVLFYRDMTMFSINGHKRSGKINKTAAALNYWLRYERTDLPVAITQMSYDSYSIPVTKDGTLPVKLFGRKLNFKRIQEKGIQWLICYGENDELVERPTALAPLNYIDVEVTGFPKGHVAIATSWSNPESACALHTYFGPDKRRGPVRFQLDLDEDLDRKHSKTKK
jgi:hypothetical protein